VTDLVHTVLSDGTGGWSLGVQGAVADFIFAGDPPRTRRTGRTVETIIPQGGLRLTITDETRAFAMTGTPPSRAVVTLFLAVPRRSLPQPTTRLTITAGDEGALRSQDRGGWLIDLGVGHACMRFCLRTSESDLFARLQAVEGSTWRDALDRVGAAIVERSPARVVTTPLGRAEVYSPIPPPGGASPAGPHTHLLPAELELGRELPPGVTLPADFAVAASFYPSPGWPGLRPPF
jgi:hypothetical protein